MLDVGLCAGVIGWCLLEGRAKFVRCVRPSVESVSVLDVLVCEYVAHVRGACARFVRLRVSVRVYVLVG